MLKHDSDNVLIETFDFAMRKLASRMLREYPVVRRWEETDDILQEASIRLSQSLMSLTVESELHAYRLAAMQIRRVLLDLTRRFQSENNFAANHETVLDGFHPDAVAPAKSDQQGVTLEEWSFFHEAIESLPASEREMFDLLWYADLSQGRVAEILGVTLRTVQRRWRTSRIALQRILQQRSETVSPASKVC